MQVKSGPPFPKKPKREVIGSHHGEAIVAATVLLSTAAVVAIIVWHEKLGS